MVELYQADWLIPISAPPIRDGGLAVDQGRILTVDRADHVRAQYPSAPVRHFGPAAILPGLVNVHSHLELTALRGYLEEPGFPAWLMKLTRARRRLSADDLLASALAGACEAIRAGITTMADIGDSICGFEALRESGQRGIFFQEIICLRDEDQLQALKRLQHNVGRLQAQASGRLRVGVSPHAPYSVVASLFQSITRYARAEQLPLCIHTAESKAEQDFLLNGGGELAGLYQTFGAPWVPPKVSSVEFLRNLGVLDAQPLLVHCVRVSDEDLASVAKSGSTIAHCPKSNAKLFHGLAPLAKFKQAGVAVGLGTDSVVSNNTYDLISEARFCALVHRAVTPEGACLRAEDVMRMATLGGAEALGLDDRVGTLEAGKEADFIAVTFSHVHAQPVYDPVATIAFSCSADDVIFTAVQGHILFDGEQVMTLNEPGIRGHLGLIAETVTSGGG